jgi:hypothetical protein
VLLTAIFPFSCELLTHRQSLFDLFELSHFSFQRRTRLIVHGDRNSITVLHLILAPWEYPKYRPPSTPRSCPAIRHSTFSMQSNTAQLRAYIADSAPELGLGME